MIIQQESLGGVVILSIEGRLDTLSFPALEKEMNKLLEQHQHHILLHCSEMDYVSSSGLRILLKALKQTEAAGGRLAISSLQPQITQIFKISGFERLFEIYPEKDLAIESFH